jgi:hypothetical protein
MKTSPDTAIRLRLRDLAQLFNSLDPSPFVDRDLDADAEEFITSWARELPAGRELELVIELAVLPSPERIAGVEDAVRRYFETRAAIKQLEFRQLMRRGRLSLAVGSLFLALCLLLVGLVAKSAFGEAGTIITEGLTICGWVAMWRPLEIYLFDWWPLAEERRRLSRLARIRVRILPSTATPAFGDNGEAYPAETVQAAA